MSTLVDFTHTNLLVSSGAFPWENCDAGQPEHYEGFAVAKDFGSIVLHSAGRYLTIKLCPWCGYKFDAESILKSVESPP